MAHESVGMQLTPSERSLLLRYVYPFARIDESGDLTDAERLVEVDPFYVRRLALAIRFSCLARPW